jgi:acylphosphatase
MSRLSPIFVVFASLLFLAFPSLGRADGGKGSGEVIGRLVHYSGQVQGVGFRATAAEIARDFPVKGWVKNLDDGRVELLVEGKENEVDKFLDAIRARWKDNIEKVQVETQKPTGEFKGFSIRR